MKRITGRLTLAAWLQEERLNLALWLPVLLGIGIALYFSLRTEPVWSVTIPVSVLVSGAALFAGPISASARMIATAACFICCGFLIAQIRTHLVHSPVIAEQQTMLVQGEVAVVESRDTGMRYLIRPHFVEGLMQNEVPDLVRITWRGDSAAIESGDVIRMRSVLSAPPPPVLPGGYDYARQLYFERIGGVGYATTQPEILSENSAHERFSLRIERLRTAIGERVRQSLSRFDPGVVAVCIVLVTGKRDAVPDHVEQALRDAGLAHLLAISGLHMGLVAGLLFFVVRFLLACSERLALRFPIKKWAAMVALVGASFYLLLSGADWSTRRAFIMAAVAFFAIIVDRRPISLRNVAIAATIILVSTPEALLQAGFQMSFAAVTVLIAGYEWYEKRNWQSDNQLDQLKGNHTRWRKFLAYFAGLSGTSVLAGFATSPFGIYHFNRYASYGLIGNLLAMPVMAFWIMPAAIIAIVLIPFGLDGIGWNLMAIGVVVVISVAEYVSSLPGAVGLVAQVSPLAFGAFILGGLFLCLLTSPLRLSGAFFLAAGLVLLTVHPVPDIILGRDGRNMAFNLGREGKDYLLPWSSRRDRFAAETWLTSAGQEADFSDDVNAPSIQSEIPHCTDRRCLFGLRSGAQIVRLRDARDIDRHCDTADLIIVMDQTDERVRNSCSALIIDRDDMRQSGAMTIRFRNGNPKISTVTDTRGERPWVTRQ